MKTLKKFWGVALVVILLSTMLVGAVPTSAADYGMGDAFLGPWSPSTFIPGSTLAPATNFGILDVAQSGATIYAVGGNTTAGVVYLEKSIDGGATWARVSTGITMAAQTFAYVAVAPDDPNIVVMIDTAPANDIVYLSTTGGTLFSSLGTPTLGALNSVTISPLTLARYITVGGAGGLSTWTLGVAAPAWANDATRGSIWAVAYSSNFGADAGLIAVAANATANTTSLQVFSRNLLQWNPTGYGYPIVIDTSAVATQAILRATITLDPNFYLGDAATQIGFVGLAGTRAGNAAYQGVYRFDVNTAGTASQIFSTTGVNSIAWDGTNLMVAPYDVAPGGALTIYRSANALSPVGVAAFFASSTFKTPGNGTLPLVLFNSGVGYAFSRGINSAIASTMDLGKTFNGFALVNSNFNLISDFTVSPDGARIYAVVDDGRAINTWTWAAGAWSRIMVTSNITGTTFLIRQDADTTDTVYLGQKNGTTMYKSADAGGTWVTRASVVAIADFAVQDINNVYVAPTTTAAFVYKSINGAFTWTPYLTGITAAGVGYSVTIPGTTESVIFGTTTGYVAYTADGTTWTAIPAPLTAGNTVATLTAGGVIFAATPASSVSSWTIGTSVRWTATAAATANVTGIVESNGVVYAESNTGLVNNIYRFLNPTFGAGFFYETRATGPTTITPTNIVNNLQASTAAGHNVIWARASNTYGPVDTLDSYSDYLITAAQALTPVYPINDAKIGVNSLNGNVANFVFQWNAPAALPFTPAQVYTYDIGVYLDELGTINMGFSSGVAGSLGGVATSYNQALFNATAGLSLQPGTTYYWQVRTFTPVWSYWSAMQTFSVQQLAAIVPVLTSPSNSMTINAGMSPAFSWNPIASVTSYKFEVSTDPAFATTIYSTTTASAGAAIPSSVKLVAGTNYFWRVKTLTPAEGDWSAVSNFSIAAPVVPPTTSVVPVVTPTITVQLPTPTVTTVTVVPAPVTENTVNPSYIWAIIIIGAVLVIAVIVLIVRTRRSV